LCGYTPFWKRALDVHHRDGDKSNNTTDNLMTLCATCHRELEASIHHYGDWEEAESWLKKVIRRLA
jgi:5-methylcytosine-specific restriction endonuclease McrA